MWCACVVCVCGVRVWCACVWCAESVERVELAKQENKSEEKKFRLGGTQDNGRWKEAGFSLRTRDRKLERKVCQEKRGMRNSWGGVWGDKRVSRCVCVCGERADYSECFACVFGWLCLLPGVLILFRTRLFVCLLGSLVGCCCCCVCFFCCCFFESGGLRRWFGQDTTWYLTHIHTCNVLELCCRLYFGWWFSCYFGLFIGERQARCRLFRKPQLF